MPSRSGTLRTIGRSFLKRGEQVRSRGYVPAGMRKSAFSSVGYSKCWSPMSKMSVPGTPLPLGVWRLRRSVIIGVAVFVVVVYPDDGACKGSGFSEGNEDGLVDLSGGVALDAHKEQRYAAEHDYCRDDQLDNIYLFVVHDFQIRCKSTGIFRGNQIVCQIVQKRGEFLSLSK